MKIIYFTRNKHALVDDEDFERVSKKWQASITFKGQYISLGRFSTEREASQMYRLFASKLFKEFANTKPVC